MIEVTFYISFFVKRHIIQLLTNWKLSPARKPLLLQGARQVGKTHAVLEFAKQNYENIHHFNFESKPELSACFERSLSPSEVIPKLEIFTGKKFETNSTLIFFDEVQLCPKVLTSLKYFYEEAPEYHVVSAGSSLGIALSGGTAFPVGKVNFLKMYPLSFEEFLEALGKRQLTEYISNISFGTANSSAHSELNELFLHYMYLGGMPEVVANFAQKRDFLQAREIQKEILNAYEQDFSKYVPPNETLKIKRIWSSIPTQLAKENKKFIFRAVAKSARAREYEVALQWLVDSSLVLRSTLAAQGISPLAASVDSESFKIFLHDVGLLCALVNLPQHLLLQEEQMLTAFQGAVFENVVAQELTFYLQENLHYWASQSQAEVDFVTEVDGSVIPLEVKSGLNVRSKSLLAFIKKYDPGIGIRISRSEITKNGKVLELPLYMLGQVKRMTNWV